MDELKIRTPFLKELISKLINKIVRKNTKCDIQVSINNFEGEIGETKAVVKVSADIVLNKEDIPKLLAQFNLF